MQINVIYDQSVSNAPAGFKTAVAAAVSYLESVFSSPITVTIDFGYGEVGGSPLAAGTIGESIAASSHLSYAQVVAALTAAATSPDDVAAVASLPATDPTNGGIFSVTSAEAKALGIFTGDPTAIDGSVGLSASTAFTFDPANRSVPGEVDAIGALEHEITEVLGRVAYAGQPLQGGGDLYAPLDLFRYESRPCKNSLPLCVIG